MNQWGSTTYGDPCGECDFLWTTAVSSAIEYMHHYPLAIGELVEGRTGTEQHPDLDWTVSEYVLHVADNLRIWAERLVGVQGRGSHVVGGYDERVLADARNYKSLPIEAALWSLNRSVGDWLTAVEDTPKTGVIMIHPDRGELELSDVVLSNTHDARHHEWDIKRTLVESN